MDIVIAYVKYEKQGFLFYALVGNTVNPQAKIVYTNYFWSNKKQDYVLKVSGQLSRSHSQLKVNWPF